MSVCITTLFGHPTDEPVELWAPDYNSNNFWLVPEDVKLNDRIDLSLEQAKELYDALDGLLS